MKWLVSHKLLASMAVIVALLLVGVGVSVSSNGAAVKTNASSTKNNSPVKTGKPSNKTNQAHVGSTIGLSGESGTGADVTLVQVLDPATGADQYTSPNVGNRFIGVQIRIKNTSSSAESIAPDNDMIVFDTQGQSYSPDIGDSLANCQGFADGGPKLAPGESALGCETFQLPTNATLAKVEFTPSSGFANDTGEWLVP